MLRSNLLSGGDRPGGSTWPRPCDTCAASPCTVYCRADAAYLCAACDARIHAANQVASRHERVLVCESCERAPAAFLCKADAASLCAACDADVHTANPLARRHHRVPILPLSGPGPSPSSAAPGNNRGATLPMETARLEDEFTEEDEDEAASWLLPNPSNNTNANTNKGYKHNNDTATNGCFVGADVDEYLDLVEFNAGDQGENGPLSHDNIHTDHTHYHHYHTQTSHDREPTHYDNMVPNDHDHRGAFKMGFDFDINSEYAYNSPSISHSVSVSSSLEVPESTASDISTTRTHPQKGVVMVDMLSSHPLQQMPMQLSPMDREARVLRYREKKKTRKFEKTIRYASRKAYAEKRPRIKGRFAKRTDGEVQVDRMFDNPVMSDGRYGIVPSF